jgi:hypothetical protein
VTSAGFPVSLENDATMGHPATTHWEYETLRPPRDETRKEATDPKADMNELAADGWRLVETIEYTGGGTKYLVFERPVRNDETETAEERKS